MPSTPTQVVGAVTAEKDGNGIKLTATIPQENSAPKTKTTKVASGRIDEGDERVTILLTAVQHSNRSFFADLHLSIYNF